MGVGQVARVVYALAHNQKITVAARAMAERKTLGLRYI